MVKQHYIISVLNLFIVDPLDVADMVALKLLQLINEGLFSLEICIVR